MSRDLAVLSQKSYPAAGDVDDCWAVATIWAHRAATGDTHLPTMTEFRAAAGNPDKPGPTGGNIADIMRACAKLWPGTAVQYSSPGWTPFVAAVKAGNIASLAVLSSKLPANLRFGFAGNHQVGVAYEGGQLVVANPLAPQGSAPIPITEDALHKAASAVANGWILAALFEATPMLNFHVISPLATGLLTVTHAGHSYLRLVDGVLVEMGVGMTKQAVRIQLTEDCPGKPSTPGQDRKSGYLVGDLAAFILATDCTFTPAVTGDAAAARKAGFNEAKAKAITAVEAI